MQELEKILEEIEKLRMTYGFQSERGQHLSRNNNMIIDAVENIIRKHMNDGWIPVEERLPEVGEYVLGTTKSGEVLIYRYGWNSPHSKKMFFHLCGAASIITAWMPCPEPYRPERSEGE